MIYNTLFYLGITYLVVKYLKYRHNSDLLLAIDKMKQYKETHGESEEFRKIMESLEKCPRFN